MNARNALMVLSMLLSVLVGAVIARGREAKGASASPGEGKVKIGLSLDTLAEARWQKDRDLFVARAAELGAETWVQAANSDDSRQMQDVEALISRGAQVLVVVAHDGPTMAKAVERAHASGIPVIAYDRMIPDAEVDLYVSFDNAKVGEQQAKYLVEHLPTPGKGRIVRIHGAPTDSNSKILKEGQDRILEPYLARGDITVVHEDWAEEWKPENGKKILGAALTKHGHAFDAVLAANDGTAGGAIQALVEEGLAGKVLVTGQDAELAALQRIAAGSQTMTIYKPLPVLARRAAEAAVRLARGKPLVASRAVDNGKLDVPSILSDTLPVDRENLVSSVVADGFLPYDEIFRGVPEAQRPARPAQP